ncbi:MAG: bifunctional 4-hydroxy-2-oxoglutarate aldolase/2-dehydro-3-deoxy-phosphogluconate aldolase [Anaerolineae bacterium]
MNSKTAYEMVAHIGVMAGMRGDFTEKTALEVTAILMEEGINVFEMTMNSPDPIEVMQAVKRTYGDDACVGMGTVLDVESAKRVLDAGADFVVSPAFQPDVVQVVLDAGVLMGPGVTTPTEAVAAWNMGVPLLKLFPIGALGLDYFTSIFGPLNHMKFMINGAMNAENAHDFLKAGAVACGMAGWLTGNGHMPHDALRQRARQLQFAIERARGVPRTV